MAAAQPACSGVENDWGLDGGGRRGEHGRGSSPMRDILGRCEPPRNVPRGEGHFEFPFVTAKIANSLLNTHLWRYRDSRSA